MNRIEVRANVLRCTRCHLHANCRAPVPFSGPAPSRVAIIGEAPGQQEDEAGKPFVGPSGVLARDLLQGARIDPESVAWCNVVSCYPHRNPTQAEVVACAETLNEQLRMIRPDFCLLFGGVAVSRFFLMEVRIGEIRGSWWRPMKDEGWGSPWCMATWHPSAVLRNPRLKPEAEADVDFFSMSCVGKDEIGVVPSSVHSWCIKCERGPAVSWKGDIGWCEKHRPDKPKISGRKARSTSPSRPPKVQGQNATLLD